MPSRASPWRPPRGSPPKGFERMGIPLRADPLALRAMQRRSFNRAVAAMAMTTRRGTTSSGTQPEEVLRANWADDDAAGRILKAASSPLTTSGFAAIQSTQVLPQIAPDCASSKLLALGAQIDLAGINSARLPYIGYTGRPAAPMFVAEAAPAPVPNLSTSGAILGPTCKVLILTRGPKISAASVTHEVFLETVAELLAPKPDKRNLHRPLDRSDAAGIP
jgi:hypothetical protein